MHLFEGRGHSKQISANIFMTEITRVAFSGNSWEIPCLLHAEFPISVSFMGGQFNPKGVII